MRIFVVLMRDDSNGEQHDSYVSSFTEHDKAEQFIYEESGSQTIIHRIDRDYDGFHYYIPGYVNERLESEIYGILTEEIK